MATKQAKPKSATATKKARKAKPKAKTKPRTKVRSKAAAKPKVKTKTKVKAKSNVKAKPKVKAKPEAKATSKAKTKPRTKVRSKAAAEKEVSSKTENAAERSGKSARDAKAVVKIKPKPIESISKSKALPKEFLIELAGAIRKAVLAMVLSAKGREVVGNATSGDATFQLDKVAEKALLIFLRDARLPVAYYSEDSGYTTFTSAQPQHLLVVDPIDGTRAAKSGFESCVVSVSSTRVIERPLLGDVDNACVQEVVQPRVFYAERGKGVRIYYKGQYKKPKLSTNTNLETVSWSMTVPARPAELIFPTAAKLIDLTSLKGGFFACNSTSYSLTRLLTNQLDACVDVANRYLRDIPQVVEDQFINAGRGAVVGMAPYDIAASVLIAEEAGCTVTDAYGASLDEVLLLDSSVTNQRSLLAAANKELHDKLMSFFDTRIRQFERLLERRIT